MTTFYGISDRQDASTLLWDLNEQLKASAHSFKRFTSRLLKVSFSLYALFTTDECHAWFHLNAASPAVRNTEQVNITKNSYLR